jgi:aquaporin Z
MEHFRKIFAELIGTFCLVFAGTGAIVINDQFGGAVTHVGIALTFGLIVTAMIYSLGEVSGAHINPAVTIGFWLARRFESALVLPYVVAQCAGAILASLTLWALFPTHENLGATAPSGAWYQTLILEFILTAILMLVILRVSNSKTLGLGAVAIAVGATVGLEAMFAGPVSGASMNPARSLGPALMSMNLSHLWIYLVATIAGAGFAVALDFLLSIGIEKSSDSEKTKRS